MDARRVLRRRGLLRRVRLPHHVAAARGARALGRIDWASSGCAGPDACCRRWSPCSWSSRAWTRSPARAEQRSQLRRDLPWSIFYVDNWGQILGGRAVLRRRPAAAAAPVEPGGRGAVVPRVAGGVRRLTLLRHPAPHGSLVGCSVAPSLVAMVVHVLAPSRRPGSVGWPSAVFDGVDRTNFMYLSTFTRVGGPAARRGGGVRLAPVASVATQPDAPGRDVLELAAVPLRSACSVLIAASAPCSPTATCTSGCCRSCRCCRWSPCSWPCTPAPPGSGASLGWRRSSRSASAATACTCGTGRSSCSSAPRRLVSAGSWSAWSHRRRRRALLPLRRDARFARARSVGGGHDRAPSDGPAARRWRGLGGALLAVLRDRRPFDRVEGGARPCSSSTPRRSTRRRRRPSDCSRAGRRRRRRPAPAVVPATSARVAIVGDSQAHALAINLPDGIDDTFAVTDGGVDGCSVYDAGSVQSRTGFGNTFSICEGWQQEWAAAAAGRRGARRPRRVGRVRPRRQRHDLRLRHAGVGRTVRHGT